MGECFRDSLDHLRAELQRIELKLHLQVVRSRQAGNQTGEDSFNGLYLSENEMDAVLRTSTFQRRDISSQIDESAIVPLAESLKQFEADITEKKNESLRRGLTLRLYEIERLFNLSAFDIDALLVCILPELDLRYQRLYAYLQNDVSKKSPTIDLILKLLYESFEDRLLARKAFYPEAPLVKYHLLHLYDGYAQKTGPLLARSLQVDERITNYLLGIDQIDASLLTFTNLLHPKVKLSDVILPDGTKNRLGKLVDQFKGKELICYFYGSHGVGKRTIAEAVCHELQVPFLNVDVNHMLTADIPLELSLPLVFREGKLQNAVLYVNDCALLLSSEHSTKSGYDCLLQELASYPHWVFLAGERDWQPPEVLQYKPLISIEFHLPSYLVRKQLWEKQWDSQPSLDGDIDFSDLAGRFRLSGGQIRDALATARSLALWRNLDDRSVTIQDLYLASRKQSRQRLNTLARQIHPKYEWDDIVLPKDQMEQLREICSYVKHYHTVYSNWGFGQKSSRGNGLNVLFAGPSGTGKTMAAEIMAAELGLDLYKIDLSTIVSKYIGETEKNLDRIFEEGQTSNAILFFDEADALFGKRSEVRDSHDRYANIEIAYLLQKMEEYDGVVILATNLRKNMDEAFARRMHFAIEFPIPEEVDRYRIWQGVFPQKAPLDNNIDLAFLARQFKITGGNIKNIALSAAFLAAQDGGSITMENLILATKREYQKMGKLCTEGDFARYFELVKG